MLKRYLSVLTCITLLGTAVGCSTNKEIQLESDIAEVYDNLNGIVTVISDDGIYYSGELLNELAKKYQFHITCAGAIRFVEDDLKDWQEIEKQGYVEVINHSYNHIRMEEGLDISFNRDELYHEIVDSDEWFEENFDGDQMTFVCPENQMCKIGYELLHDNGFFAVRQGSRGFNELSPEEGDEPFQWFNLGTYGVGDVETTAERNQWVDYAINQHKWLIEMWHNVTYEDDGTYQRISYEMADEHMNYIAQQRDIRNVWVASFNDATKYIREKQHSVSKASLIGNELHVQVDFADEVLPQDIFDYPVTVKVELPPKYQGKDYFDADGNVLNKAIEEQKVYVLVNVIPNNGDYVVTMK